MAAAVEAAKQEAAKQAAAAQEVAAVQEVAAAQDRVAQDRVAQAGQQVWVLSNAFDRALPEGRRGEHPQVPLDGARPASTAGDLRQRRRELLAEAARARMAGAATARVHARPR